MSLDSLREQVLHANREIARRGLAPHTFGNASGIDRSGAKPLVVIKPSGVDYAELTPADLVVTDLDGKIVEGSLRPSSDLDTHTLLYREFPQLGGIVHTHSEFATSWAQACRPIPSSKLPLRRFLARISACPTARPVSGFGRRLHSVRACEGSGARLHVRGFPWASD